MNWKSILYKGLPVLIIAIAIVVVAILLSRPEPLPQVTDEDKTIIEFKDYKVTKGQLYDLLKISTDVDSMTNTGLATLINKINQELLDKALENYEVDQDKLDEKIAAEIDKLDEDTYYEKLILLGIIDSKNDPDLNDKLANYYKLDFLKEAYAYEQAEKEVDEDEEALNEAIDDYKDMACGIILKYNTKSQADSIERQLETEEDVESFFIKKWNNLQEEKDEDDDEDELELPEFITEFNCENDKIIYSELNSGLRDFIYSSDFQDDNGNLAPDSYNEKGRLISSGNERGYYFVYIVGLPTYDLEGTTSTNFREAPKFIEYIKKDLIDDMVTSDYTEKQLSDLRKDIKLKIYDKTIGEHYQQEYDSKFKIEEKLLKSDKTVVASYKIDNKTIYITANDLYSLMKEKYGMYVLIDKLNYEALKTITDIRLSKKDEEEIRDKIAQLKEAYLASYSQLFSWQEFLAYTQGVSNENDLFDFLAADKLIERYQFGYKSHKPISVVKDEALEKAYNEWFRIKASHILFEYDPEDEVSKAEAKALAEQVIYGCTDDGEYREGVTEDACKIRYKIELDEDETEEDRSSVPFVGLDETDVKDWDKVFKALASEYSDEPNADTSGGDLGYFGPGAMVKGFEDAILDIAKQTTFPFGITPEGTEIKREDKTIYAFHAIYVTDIDESKPDKPEDEEEYKEYLADLEKDLDKDDLTEKYGDKLAGYETYKKFMDERLEELEKELRTAKQQNIVMAKLRNSLATKIKIQDNALKQIFSKLNQYYISLEDETETE